MSLPGVTIPFENGNTGTVVPSEDKVLGLVVNAEAVSPTFELDTPYIVKGMTSVAALGIIDSIENHILYKTLKEFYDEAGEGTELWLMGIDRTMKMSEAFTPDGSGVAPVHTLLNTANGRLRGILTAFNPDNTYTSTITAGLDSDVIDTIEAAQILADNYTAQKYAPIFVLVEGYNFSGTTTALPTLLTRSENRCGIVLGDTETRTGTTASKGCAIGVLGGRIASNQVHVNIGKVKSGALKPSDIYLVDTKAELFDVESLHDKGYITFRTIEGRTGYFFTYDPLSCPIDDDYHSLARRRTIDKAYRIGYRTLSNYILDDFDLNPDGTLSVFDAKTIEGDLIKAIFDSMTSAGELSYDKTNKDDKGVICQVDLTQNVLSTGKIKLSYLRVKSKGYGFYLEVPLGFAPVS